MITVDGIAWACAMTSQAIEWDHAKILLRLDGVVVAQRSFASEVVPGLQVEGPWRMPVGLSWLSPSLSAGAHPVSVEVWNPDGFDFGSSGCVGSAAEPDLKARLVAVELRP